MTLVSDNNTTQMLTFRIEVDTGNDMVSRYVAKRYLTIEHFKILETYIRAMLSLIYE